MLHQPFLVIANWKMNPLTLKEARRLLANFENGIKSLGRGNFAEKVELVVCPPSIYLHGLLRNRYCKLGIQNIFHEDRGAYTGEIAPRMAEDAGCQYVIIGHSERRNLFGESDELVNWKMRSALQGSLKPVLCVGENREQRDNGETTRVIANQIKKAFSKISVLSLSRVAIAYEPVWAISSMGKDRQSEADDPNDIMGITIFIRKILSDLYKKDIAEKVRILYGGSINSKNVEKIIKVETVQGILVGGASVSALEFLPILKQAYNRQDSRSQ